MSMKNSLADPFSFTITRFFAIVGDSDLYLTSTSIQSPDWSESFKNSNSRISPSSIFGASN